MARKRSNQQGESQALHSLYAELDRLEELLEDMAELKVTSVSEAEQRIVELNRQIDALEENEAG
jgi:polyhydroxyalkanoate synthesis regulator phasin